MRPTLRRSPGCDAQSSCVVTIAVRRSTENSTALTPPSRSSTRNCVYEISFSRVRFQAVTTMCFFFASREVGMLALAGTIVWRGSTTGTHPLPSARHDGTGP